MSKVYKVSDDGQLTVEAVKSIAREQLSNAPPQLRNHTRRSEKSDRRLRSGRLSTHLLRLRRSEELREGSSRNARCT